MIMLDEFLVRAKRRGYADVSAKPVETPDGAKVYRYSEKETKGNLEYRLDYEDRYCGYYAFFGTEIVRLNNNIIWGMSYSGRLLPKYQEPAFAKQTYAFLKEALRRAPQEKPFRGPENFKQGEYEYFNTVDGNINFFKGTEVIFFKGEEVCILGYSGAMVQDK